MKISTIFSYVGLMHMEFNYLFILKFFLENALNYLNIAVTLCTATWINKNVKCKQKVKALYNVTMNQKLHEMSKI